MASFESMYNRCMAVRSLKMLGGGQSKVQKGTLLMMIIWHQKKGTFSQKGHFFPRLPGGGVGTPPPPAPPARYGPEMIMFITTDSDLLHLETVPAAWGIMPCGHEPKVPRSIVVNITQHTHVSKQSEVQIFEYIPLWSFLSLAKYNSAC